MAARKNPNPVQKTRERIQTTQLVKRLMLHALSDEDVMTPSQVNAAKILIGKTLPDMKAIEVSTGTGHEEWLKLIAGDK